VVALASTVLRYPGGTQADAYNWQAVVGADGTCLHVFANVQQTVRFGIMEFLDLCGQTGAAPLITVNLVEDGSPPLSAAWLGFVNDAPPTRLFLP
jgi:alpha-L-arabinofuranosidase